MSYAHFFEVFDEEEAALRRFLGPDVSVCFHKETIQEFGLSGPPARFISIRTQSVVPERWIGHLDAILTRSTGYDHVADLAVPHIGHLPSYCANAVAEHALIAMGTLLRRWSRQRRQFGRFDRDGLTGGELAGRSLVVFGVGEIGARILRLGRAVGMRAVGFDRVRRFSDVPYVDLDGALGRAQVAVCAMSLNDDSRGFFTDERLSKLPAGAVFVNISRGEISPPGPLLRALERGHLGGVALDVYDDERRLANALRGGVPPVGPSLHTMALSRRDDVVLTPHNAFNSIEALENKARDAVHQLEHFREKGVFRWSLSGS